ncbi:outer membrane beta-barrel protein [Cytophagaceae bacterium SJW1-29]|uniref:Outer membrane beta-barrel protein n=2 Tax=Salmonirosea aquatica TaxID=2654236 RepID=A0A7C9F8A2_9BACT|nr:outer membrane beta-barrel protein [Cytophagaceae bacterium SJW1-29]
MLVFRPSTHAQARIEGLGSVPPEGVITLMVGAGVAYYMGDLVDGVDFAHLGLGPNLALGGMYRLTEHVSLRSELRYYQVQGDQQYSRNAKNNLSFRTRNPDIYIGAQGDLFPFSRQVRANPYLFAGLGTTILNPKANLGGTWYSLPPLTTEGVNYSQTPLLVVAGIGFTYRLTGRWGLGLELCNNFLSSDYLDDVSGFYPEPDALPNDLARQLSDRAPEIGQAPNQPGFQRGNPKVKDSYVFLSVKAQYLLTTRYFAQQRKKTRCPKF